MHRPIAFSVAVKLGKVPAMSAGGSHRCEEEDYSSHQASLYKRIIVIVNQSGVVQSLRPASPLDYIIAGFHRIRQTQTVASAQGCCMATGYVLQFERPIGNRNA